MADERIPSARARRARSAATPKQQSQSIDDFLGGAMPSTPTQPLPASDLPEPGGWVAGKDGVETYEKPPAFPNVDAVASGKSDMTLTGADAREFGRRVDQEVARVSAPSIVAPFAPQPPMTPVAFDDTLNGQRSGKADLPPTYARIIKTTFAFDADVVFATLDSALTLPKPAYEMGYTELSECLDDAARHHRDASRLFAHAKVTLAEFDADCEVMRGDMRTQAVAQLKAEKEEKGGKQITDGDVTTRMAALFPDEYRRQESLKAKAKATVGHLETMVKGWELRRRELGIMLSECRNRI